MTVTKPASDKPASEAPAAADPRKVDLTDADGQPIGVSVTLKDELAAPEEPEPDEAKEVVGLRRLAKSISGWSHLVVDGESYPFSQARALALFQRFPHFADQVGRALNKKASA